MKWNFGNLGSMEKILTVIVWKIWKAGGRGAKTKIDNFVGPKQSSISTVLNKNGKQDGGISVNLE